MVDFEKKLDQIRESIFDHTPLPQLYHYTNMDALQKIIDSSEWWATHYLYLNDGKEIVYGDELIDEELKSYIKNQHNPWIKKAIQESRDLSSMLNVNHDLYVVAFSEDKDSLEQWRAYGDNGSGYSIGINPHQLAKKSLKFLKVIYNEEDQRRLIRESLDKACEVLGDALDNVETDLKKQEVVTKTAQYLGRIRIDYSLSFKHPTFHNEKEWRIVIEKWNRFPDSTRNHDAFKKIFYRSANGIAVPYLKIDFQWSENKTLEVENLLPFTQIIIGPKHKLKYLQAEKSLEMLLRTKGYREAVIMPVIHSSKVPYQ